MSTITDFKCIDEKNRDVPCDAFGNNVALSCPNCSHPILAIARPNQRGSSSENPAECRKCNLAFWIEIVGGNGLRLHTKA